MLIANLRKDIVITDSDSSNGLHTFSIEWKNLPIVQNIVILNGLCICTILFGVSHLLIDFLYSKFTTPYIHQALIPHDEFKHSE